MNQITFNNLKSYDNLHLILSKKEIGSPKAKTHKISIEGADSAIDLTEFFGGVNYDNRELKFYFSSMVTPFADNYSAVLGLLHGQIAEIILDDDPEWYYMGRLSVSSYITEKTIGKIEIEADCEPYKYKKDVTVATFAISGTNDITLQNSRKRVVPKIQITAAMNLVYEGGEATLGGAGIFTIPSLELKEGSNPIRVTGEGDITFTYQEGAL